MPTTVAEGTTFDIGGIVTNMANQVLTGVTDTVTALIPVITMTVLIGVAIRMFKKYVK